MLNLLDGTHPSNARRTALGPQDRIRTNSRRGLTDDSSRSYPPVEAVVRAFVVLRAVNRLRIASIIAIH